MGPACSASVTTGQRPRTHRSRWTVAASLLLCIGGCDLGSGPTPVPNSMEVFSGDNQSATVGTPVPVPPAVRLLNRRGKPMKGREVVFSVTSGGGRLSSNVTTTDRQGIAQVGTWILGTTAGVQTAQARVPELPPLVLTATGVPANPATVTLVEGNLQIGVVGSALQYLPSVQVKDVYGNPVGNTSVAFNVTSGGGFVEQNVAVTDPSGIATSGEWTLGTTPGPNALSAVVPGLAPVGFLATAKADVPHRVTVLLGEGQSATVGTELPVRPTVLVTDRFGNPLEGVEVTFDVTLGGGTIENRAPVTGESGAAVAGPWILGIKAGVQAIEIKVYGLDPLTLTAMAEPGPPASALGQGGGTQTATVGTSVDQPPTVRVEDAFGNGVPAVLVTFSPVASPDPDSSPSEIDGGEVITDEMGLAASGSWTLGPKAGSYVVEAEIAGLAEVVAFFASATPDVPSAVLVHGGDEQTAPVGTAVSLPLSARVEDRHGNGVAQVPVSFSVLEGGGVLSGAQAVTNGDGVATLAGWTLGPVPGKNRVVAEVAGVGSVTFQAVAITAPPAALVQTAGDGQTATVGTRVLISPQVRVTDAGGDPVADVPVVFFVSSGGGSVTQGEAITDEDGLASVGDWTMGQQAGRNTLSASAGGLAPVEFSAEGLAGPPASMSVNKGNGQSGLVDQPLTVPPSVLVRDSYGNPTGGVLVTFTVTEGGGTIAGSPSTTNELGLAEAGSWTLGPAPGLNQLAATALGLSGVVFQANGLLSGGFNLEVDFLTDVEASQAAVFTDAAARWEGIILGDLPDYSGSLPAGGCQPVAEPDGVDDVIVYVTVLPIDGVGGVLGRAGPCYYRIGGGAFPLTGIMELDEADLNELQLAGVLQDVIVHEMGHILGFGTLWNASTNDLLVGGGTSDPYFDGSAAIAAFDAAGGVDRTDPKVPVENTGGPGTRDGHWRESVHDSELMTGWIEAGGAVNPLSAITIASFADMGYVVNLGAADPYVLFNPLGAPKQEPSGVRIYIQELPPPTPIPAGSGGGP